MAKTNDISASRIFGKSYIEVNFSVIITTHSPFLLSDIPDSLILKIDNQNGKLNVKKGDGGYGNNILELLRNTFFLDSPIGLFAENKINILMSKIRGNKYDNISILKSEIDLIEEQNIRNILLEELRSNRINENTELIKRLDSLNEEIELIKKKLSEGNNIDSEFE